MRVLFAHIGSFNDLVQRNPVLFFLEPVGFPQDDPKYLTCFAGYSDPGEGFRKLIGDFEISVFGLWASHSPPG